MMSYECLKHRQDHLLLQKFPLNTDRFSCRLQNIVDDSVRKKWLILMQLPLPVIRFLTFRKVLWSTQDLRSKPKCSHVLFVHEILRLLTVLIRFLGSKLMWKCSLIISMNLAHRIKIGNQCAVFLNMTRWVRFLFPFWWLHCKLLFQVIFFHFGNVRYWIAFNLDDTNSFGFHPSLEPTELKYPAENPPVKAPWNLRRPWSSVTTWNLVSKWEILENHIRRVMPE